MKTSMIVQQVIAMIQAQGWAPFVSDATYSSQGPIEAHRALSIVVNTADYSDGPHMAHFNAELDSRDYSGAFFDWEMEPGRTSAEVFEFLACVHHRSLNEV